MPGLGLTLANRIQKSGGKGRVRYKRIRALLCFKDMYDRMLAGWSLDQLVRFVQVDNKEATDIKADSLLQQLKHFKSEIPPGEFLSAMPPPDIVQQRMRPMHEKAMKQLEEGLDELKEIQKLYFQQLERIEIDTAVEKRQKKLIPSMTQEVRIAKELLMESAKLKMDLGLNKRHLGVMETEARIMKDVSQKYGDKRVAKAVGDSQSRRRLAGAQAAFERFLITAGGDAGKTASLLEELIEDPEEIEEEIEEEIVEEISVILGEDKMSNPTDLTDQDSTDLTDLTVDLISDLISDPINLIEEMIEEIYVLGKCL